jgi:hypothetical protein
MRIIKSNYDVNTIGVEWTTTNTSPTLVQTDQYGNAITMTAAMWAGHKLFGAIRRVNLADNGTVNYVYGDANFKYDGTAGQVMVQIPKFYYRNDSLANKYRYTISPSPRAGYKIHPAFVVDGVEKNYIYVSAFEGAFEAGSPYKLQSIAGVAPSVSQDLPTFRTRAQARGTGWELIDWNTVSAIQLLFIIRNCTLNSQSVYQGITDATNTGAVNTGFTAGGGSGSTDLGNASGEATSQGTAAKRSFSIFGIENFYGNIYKWIDGVKLLDRRVWIANHGFNDSGTYEHPYVDTGLNMATINGEEAALPIYSSTYDYLFIPATQVTNASFDTYLCDTGYSATGNKAVLFGGRWFLALVAGAFCVNAYYAASNVSSYFGGRAVFK